MKVNYECSTWTLARSCNASRELELMLILNWEMAIWWPVNNVSGEMFRNSWPMSFKSTFPITGRLRIWKTPRVVAKEVELYQASAWDREGQSSDAQSSTPCIVERRLVEHGDIVPVDNYFALRCVGTTLMTASPGIASLWGE